MQVPLKSYFLSLGDVSRHFISSSPRCQHISKGKNPKVVPLGPYEVITKYIILGFSAVSPYETPLRLLSNPPLNVLF